MRERETTDRRLIALFSPDTVEPVPSHPQAQSSQRLRGKLWYGIYGTARFYITSGTWNGRRRGGKTRDEKCNAGRRQRRAGGGETSQTHAALLAQPPSQINREL